MILKSQPIHHPFLHIRIFPRWSSEYQFYLSNKDPLVEILTFFLIICGRLQECVDRDSWIYRDCLKWYHEDPPIRVLTFFGITLYLLDVSFMLFYILIGCVGGTENGIGNWNSNSACDCIHFILMLLRKSWIYIFFTQLWVKIVG